MNIWKLLFNNVKEDVNLNGGIAESIFPVSDRYNFIKIKELFKR